MGREGKYEVGRLNLSANLRLTLTLIVRYPAPHAVRRIELILLRHAAIRADGLANRPW